ncbi:hypothetical protein [Spirosoma aerophilum]
MKQALYLLTFLVSSQLIAQSNYVANTANSFSPGTFNTFVGPGAGNTSMTSGQNTFIGNGAGSNNTTGFANTYVGAFAGVVNSTGAINTFIGNGAGQQNETGNSNAFIGSGAGSQNTSGSYNSFVGPSAGQSNLTGDNNSFMGYLAGWLNTSGVRNAFFGSQAGYSTTKGNYNTYLGGNTGFSNKTGNANTMVGFSSGNQAIADSNTFVGYQAGYATTTGKGNTFFGTKSGQGNVTGNHNTFVGNGAGPASSNSDNNVYLGYNTGLHDRGYQNTFLGTEAGVLLADNGDPLFNATAIGAHAKVASSNAVILGNQANVGIGTSAPTARLEVNSGVDNQSGVRLSQLTTDSPVQIAIAEKVLTVDKTGQLVLTPSGRFLVRTVADWSDKVFAPAYKLQTLAEVERYIQQNQHLPGVPSAQEVVKNGVEVGKMEAKLLEKIEELTLYSIQQQKEIDELKRLVKQLADKK